MIYFSNQIFQSYDDWKLYIESKIYQENGFYKIRIYKKNHSIIPNFRKYDKLYTYLHFITKQIDQLYIKI